MTESVTIVEERFESMGRRGRKILKRRRRIAEQNATELGRLNRLIDSEIAIIALVLAARQLEVQIGMRAELFLRVEGFDLRCSWTDVYEGFGPEIRHWVINADGEARFAIKYDKRAEEWLWSTATVPSGRED